VHTDSSPGLVLCHGIDQQQVYRTGSCCCGFVYTALTLYAPSSLLPHVSDVYEGLMLLLCMWSWHFGDLCSGACLWRVGNVRNVQQGRWAHMLSV